MTFSSEMKREEKVAVLALALTLDLLHICLASD